MKPSDYRQMSDEQLDLSLKDVVKNLFHLRFQSATDRLETPSEIQKAKKDVVIMHPGPINRGVELSGDVADGKQSVILDQVTNGVAVRMAVLYLLAGGQPERAEAAKGPAE